MAFKNSVGARRTAWRAITAIEQKEEAKGSSYLELIRSYKKKVENELEKICGDILDTLDNHLIPDSKESSESNVFYLKMKEDYCR